MCGGQATNHVSSGSLSTFLAANTSFRLLFILFLFSGCGFDVAGLIWLDLTINTEQCE